MGVSDFAVAADELQPLQGSAADQDGAAGARTPEAVDGRPAQEDLLTGAGKEPRTGDGGAEAKGRASLRRSV